MFIDNRDRMVTVREHTINDLSDKEIQTISFALGAAVFEANPGDFFYQALSDLNQVFKEYMEENM